MKKIKWKQIIITSIFTLLPIVYGIILWDKLPDVIATHFGINGNPDGFSSKGFAVFGTPLIMTALQVACCIFDDVKEEKKNMRASKWIVPLVCNVIVAAVLAFALGININMTAVGLSVVAVCIIIGVFDGKINL